MAGKGDTYRSVDRKRYEANHDMIFKPKRKIPPPGRRLSIQEARQRVNEKFGEAFSRLQG